MIDCRFRSDITSAVGKQLASAKDRERYVRVGFRHCHSDHNF